MNKRLIKIWIKLLESGKYKAAKGSALKNKRGEFTASGLFYEFLTNGKGWDNSAFDFITPQGNRSSTPEVVCQKVFDYSWNNLFNKVVLGKRLSKILENDMSEPNFDLAIKALKTFL